MLKQHLLTSLLAKPTATTTPLAPSAQSSPGNYWFAPRATSTASLACLNFASTDDSAMSLPKAGNA